MFSTKPTTEKLRQYKKIKLSGMKFIIKKLNPLVDFPSGRMPQIFTYFVSRRKAEEPVINEAVLRKNLEDMKAVIVAGVVRPEIGEKIQIEDILANSVLALKLYTEIIIHSLNMFKGVKGLFFSVKTRRAFYTEYRKNMESLQMKSPSQVGDSQ